MRHLFADLSDRAPWDPGDSNAAHCNCLAMKNNKNKRGKGYSSTLPDGQNALSHCARKYAASLADPFEGPPGACIPDAPALMTGRYRVFARGTFTTSSNAAALGRGFIWTTPLNTAFSDVAGIYISIPAGTSPTFTIAVAGAVPVFTNSQFVQASISVGALRWRVVSHGIRIKFNGNQLNRGGTIVGLHEPSHESLVGKDPATMLTYAEAVQFAVTDTDDWITLIYRPVTDNDFNYVSAVANFGAGGNGGYMGFMVQSHDSTGANIQSFEYEVYTNIEIQGSLVQNKIPSHVDVVGLGAINAIGTLSPALQKPTLKKSSDLANASVHAASSYVQTSTSSVHGPVASSSKTTWWHELLELAPDIIGAVMKLL